MEKLNKHQAAAHLGISVRTLLRLTGKQIAHLPKKRPSEETFYDEAELDRYQRETDSAIVSGTVAPDASGNGALARVPDVTDALGTGGGLAILQSIFEQMQEQARQAHEQTKMMHDAQRQTIKALQAVNALASIKQVPDALFLSIPEAARVCGVSVARIREAVKANKLKARKGIGRGKFGKIFRADLEKWARNL